MFLIKKIIDIFLSNLVGYYDEELRVLKKIDKNYQFCSAKNSENPNKLITILSRNNYTELRTFFPIESEKELRKVVALSLSDGEFYLPKYNENSKGFDVYIWKINSKISLKSKIVIPESLLMAQSIDDNAVYIFESKLSEYFIIKQKGLFNSINMGALISTPESFANASGVTFNKTSRIKQENIATFLVSGLKLLSPKWLIYLKFRREVGRFNMKPYVLGFILFSSAYLLLSSAYLLQKESSIKGDLSVIGKDVDSLLVADNKLNIMLEDISLKSAFIEKHRMSSYLWDALAGLYQTKNKLTRIQLLNGRYVIRGEGEKATEVLAMLNNQPNIVGAKFDTPVITRRKREHFIISFSLDYKKGS